MTINPYPKHSRAFEREKAPEFLGPAKASIHCELATP